MKEKVKKEKIRIFSTDDKKKNAFYINVFVYIRNTIYLHNAYICIATHLHKHLYLQYKRI